MAGRCRGDEKCSTRALRTPRLAWTSLNQRAATSFIDRLMCLMRPPATIWASGPRMRHSVPNSSSSSSRLAGRLIHTTGLSETSPAVKGLRRMASGMSARSRQSSAHAATRPSAICIKEGRPNTHTESACGDSAAMSSSTGSRVAASMVAVSQIGRGPTWRCCSELSINADGNVNIVVLRCFPAAMDSRCAVVAAQSQGAAVLRWRHGRVAPGNTRHR